MNKLASILMGLIFWTFAFAETKEYEVNGVKFNMIYVEGGTFTMGSLATENNAETDEENHKVVLTNYYIGETEVTQALWTAVMSRNPSYFKSDSLYPVESICYAEAMEFIEKLNLLTQENFSLPTEAEWEYAAKGGNNHNEFIYSGSNDISSIAVQGNNLPNIKSNATNATYRVASKQPNSLGIYDMSGNVYEWCADWYYHKYSTDTEVNPTGPQEGRFRVVRGGCWSSEPYYCRVAKRVYITPKKRYSNVGLRLCLRK